jgi:hypothetical protein
MLIQQLLAMQQTQKVDEEIVSERYDTSADWDADMDKLQEHLKAALAIMDSPNWAKHVDDTEKNFDVDGLRSTHDSLYDAVDEANTLAKDFYLAMEQAA